MNRRSFVMLFFVLSAILLAGCASKTPEPVTFNIVMTEYAFTPDKLEAKVGQQVTLELINEGQLSHEIMFGRDVMKMDGRPNGYQHDMFMEAGVEPMMPDMMMEDDGHEEEEEHDGFMVLLHETGDQATMSFTVTEEMLGEWEIGCFELNGVHYDAGMVGTFVVTR